MLLGKHSLLGLWASRNGRIVDFQSLFFTKMALHGAQINGILASILIGGIDLPDPLPYVRCPLSPVSPVSSVCFACLGLVVGHSGFIKQKVECHVGRRSWFQSPLGQSRLLRVEEEPAAPGDVPGERFLSPSIALQLACPPAPARCLLYDLQN